jgi:hypothetical protein
VVISLLAGDTWGYRSFSAQQIEKEGDRPIILPGWFESVELYFAHCRVGGRGEVPYLLAGFAGAWIGLRLLKSAETGGTWDLVADERLRSLLDILKRPGIHG